MVATAPSVTRQQGHHIGGTRPRRDVGRIGLLFAGVGSIIGSGWLFGAMNASQMAGPAAIISWLIGMVVILLIGLVYAELGPMFPVSGGVVRLPQLSFGSFASYSMGWITWLAVATVAPIEVEGALQYATKYAPLTTKHLLPGAEHPVHTLTGLGYVFAVLGMGLFVIINYLGVRFFARINNVLVGWKLAIILVVVVSLFIASFHGNNFTSHGFAPTGTEGIFGAVANAGILFSFLGFRQAVELAGETDNPRRNIPFAIIGSVLLCGAIYVLLQIAFIGALRHGDLSRGWPKMDFTNDFGPLAAMATFLGLGWLAALLYIDAVASPADTGLVYTTVTARVSAAMAHNRNAPTSLAKNNSQGVPWVSLLLAFFVGLIVFLPFPSWQQLVGFITAASVLSFGSGPLVHAAMRRQMPDYPRKFRLPGGDVLPVAAFAASNLVVYWTGWETNWKLFVAILLGFVVLAVMLVTGRIDRSLDLKAGASWIVPWLAGLALISYFGDYGGGRGVIGLWSGFALTVVWSVVIYVIALKFRLSPTSARKHVDECLIESGMTEAEIRDGIPTSQQPTKKDTADALPGLGI